MTDTERAVNTAEESPSSVVGDETTTTQPTETQAAPLDVWSDTYADDLIDAETNERSKFIPRERFDPVYEELKALRPLLPHLREIQAAGGAEALEAAIREENQAAAQAARDRTEQERLDRIAEAESEVDRKIADGTLDPSEEDWAKAQARENAELRPIKEERDRQEYEKLVTESVNYWAGRYPLADPEAIRNAVYADRDAEGAARASHTYQQGRQAGAGAQQQAQANLDRLRAIPTPEGKGNGAGPTPTRSNIPDPLKDPKAFREYQDNLRAKWAQDQAKNY